MLRLGGSTLARAALRAQRFNGCHGVAVALSRSSVVVCDALVLPGQRRGLSSSSTSTNSATQPELVYQAPMARAVRLMKGVSVTSCALTLVGMPALCVLSEQSASIIGKWAMCGTIMLFGLGTTSLYHVLFKPYVMRMWIDRSENRVTAETVTLFARLTTTDFALGDVTRPPKSMHPMISFRAGEKDYFIHPECLQDDDLVKVFMGEDFKVHRATVDKEDESTHDL
ncbi:hypothetical protein PINS_up000219 [Pythium insidiosum]|nr:hypothetical protein PINS_up000219 [Pythium insidiosum]